MEFTNLKCIWVVECQFRKQIIAVTVRNNFDVWVWIFIAETGQPGTVAIVNDLVHNRY